MSKGLGYGRQRESLGQEWGNRLKSADRDNA